MAKQLNFTMNIDANISKAKKQLGELGAALNKIAAGNRSKGDSLISAREIREAADAAKLLQKHLRQATDIDTGKINLATFSSSLKKSGTSLLELKKSIVRIGPSGEEAFLKMSRSIAYSEAPLRRTNSMMQEFATSLKNTARWQLSSSILHGFMGSLQKAYSYAKDLNRSLNEIRIVTGSSSDEMARFAARANMAAKELSSTTTNYTDAALIFFQQGLGEKEVLERTNAVIKMSNVTRESADSVSSYMTAIWNNFDDGTKQLEYYADVITALGAATASSSKEIAGGLEKFVAIGKQIGLSYEYATSALATVVAQTRQSEEVVGTAFKTIFARIQGLKLGETLEDGTELNKYSEALATIGISIKDSTGNLKDMDQILNDLGSKWGSLTKDVQVATAQTVAGTRQYNQLISLMSNWDVFKDNLSIASNSTGALNQQFQIYEESWEASSKRLKATLEDVYSTVIDEDFLILVNDGARVLTDSIGGLIKGFGGLQGMILSVSGIFAQKYAKEAPVIIDRLKEQFLIFTSYAKKGADELRNANIASITEEKNNSLSAVRTGDADSSVEIAYTAKVTALEKLAQKKQELFLNESKYNSVQRAELETEIALLEYSTSLVEEKSNALVELNDTNEARKRSVKNRAARTEGLDENISIDIEEYARLSQKAGEFEKVLQSISRIKKSFVKGESLPANPKDLDEIAVRMKSVAESMSLISAGRDSNLSERFQKAATEVSKLHESFKKNEITAEEFSKKLKEIANSGSGFNKVDQEAQETERVIRDLEQSIESTLDGKNGAKGLRRDILELGDSYRDLGGRVSDTAFKTTQMENADRNLRSEKERLSVTIVKLSGALSSIGGLMSSWSYGSKTLTDETVPAIQKVAAGIGMLTSLTTTLNMVNDLSITKWIGVKFAAMGAMGATIGALAPFAIVGGVVASLFLLVKAFESVGARAKEVKKNLVDTVKAAEEMKNNFQDAKTALEDLKASISNYENVEKSLEVLTKGSYEYAEALKEANRQAQELIDKSGGRLKGIIDENGKINISKEDLLEYKKSNEERVRTSEDAVTLSQYNIQRANSEKDFFDAINKISGEGYLYDGGLRDENGGVIYEHGFVDGDRVFDELTVLKEELRDIPKEQRQEAISTKLNELIDPSTLNPLINEQRDKIARAISQFLETEDSSLNYFKIASRDTLQSNRNFNKSENKEGISNLVAESVKTDYLEKLKHYQEKAEDEDESVLKEYMMSHFNIDESKFSIKDSDNGTFEVELYDKDGNATNKTITKQMIAQELASRDSQKSQEDFSKGIAEAIRSLEEKNLGAYGKIISNNLEGLTKKDLLSFGDGKLEENISSEKLNSLYKGVFSHEKIGITQEEFEKRFEQGREAVEKWRQLEGTFVSKFNSDISDSLTFADSKKWNESFAKLDVSEAGRRVGEKLRKTIEDGIGSIQDPEKKSEALKSLSSIDWSSWDAAEQAGNIIASFGGNLDTASESFKTFSKELREASGATPDLDKLIKSLEGVHSIVSKLSFGSVINEKDYDVLVGYKAEWENFFITMSDGSKKFIGDKNQLSNSLFDSLKEEEKTIREKMKAQTALDKLNIQKNGSTIDFSSYDVKADKTAAIGDLELVKNGITDEILSAIGFNRGELTRLSGLTAETATEEDLTKISEFYRRVGEIQTKDFEMTLKYNSEKKASTAESVGRLKALLSEGEIDASIYEKAISGIANAAKTFEELSEVFESGSISVKEYESNLVRLSEQYDNCKESVDNYLAALLQGTEAQKEGARYALEASVFIGEQSKKYGLNASEVQEYAKSLAALGENAKKPARDIAKLAIANSRLDKGLLSLNQNLKEYREGLKRNSRGTAEWSRAAGQMKNDLANILNFADSSLISDGLLEAINNSKHLTSALNGNAEAILALREIAGDEVINDIAESLGGASQNAEVFTKKWDAFKSSFNQDLEAGKLDNTQLVESFNELIEAGNMTKEQIEAVLSSLNVAADLDVEYVEVKQLTPNEITTTTSETTSPAEYDKDDATAGVGMFKRPASFKRTTQTVQGEPTLASHFIPKYKLATKAGKNAQGNNVSVGFRRLGAPTASYSSTTGGVANKGGGGGNKPKNKEDIKRKPYKPDRYHELEKQLESLERKYSKVNSAKDAAFGSSKIKEIKKEEQALDAIIAKNDELLKVVRKNIKDGRKAISEMGIGASFDRFGNITNYNEVMQKLERERDDAKQKAVDTFNRSKKTDADEEAFKRAAEAADEIYQRKTDTIADYESDVDKADKVEEEKLKRKREKIESYLSGIRYTIDLKVAVDDSALKDMEWRIKNLNDKEFSTAQKISNMKDVSNLKFSTQEENLNGISKIFKEKGGVDIKDLSKKFNANGVSEKDQKKIIKQGQKALEKMKDSKYIEELDSMVERANQLRNEIYDMRDNAWASFSEGIDQAHDKMDKLIGKMDSAKKVVSHYKNIIDIVGKKPLGVMKDFVTGLGEKSLDVSRAAIRSSKKAMENAQETLDKLKKKRDKDKTADDFAKKRYEEQISKAEDRLAAAQEKFQSSWRDALIEANELWEKSVEYTIDTFKDKLAGTYSSFTEMQEEFKRKNSLNDLNVSDYEKIYSLSKLTRDVKKSVDESKNLKTKDALLKIEEEISELQESNRKMSKYELDHLRKKYELKKAELELDENSKNKSSVRLIRDEAGRMNYLYTADENDVAKAEQNYEDKLYEMQKLNSDYIKDLQSQIIQTEAEAADALAKIKQSDYNSYEEWKAAINRVQSYYKDKMDFYYSQLDKGLANNKSLYDSDWREYNEKTGYKISENERFVDSFQETTLSIVKGHTSSQEANSAWSSALSSTLIFLSNDYLKWKGNVKAVMKSAGTSVSNFKKDANKNLSEVNDDLKKTEKKFNKFSKKVGSSIDDAIKKLADLETKNREHLKKVGADVDNLVGYYNKLKEAIAAAVSEANSAKDIKPPQIPKLPPIKGTTVFSHKNNSSSTSRSSGNSSSNNNFSSRTSPPLEKNKKVEMPDIYEEAANRARKRRYLNERWESFNRIAEDRWIHVKTGEYIEGNKVRAVVRNGGKSVAIYAKKGKEEEKLLKYVFPKNGHTTIYDEYVPYERYKMYDTGGYTGNWGSKEGKIAMLHEKEIVLNKEDTKNFLSAVNIVRKIAETIDLNAVSARGAFNSIISATIPNNSQVVEQKVQITAEFPNATNHSEIEEAFNNLINTASQYAGRRK